MEGWGTLSQARLGGSQRNTIEVRWGRLRLRTVAVEIPADCEPSGVEVAVGDRTLTCTWTRTGDRVVVTLDDEAVVNEGEALDFRVTG